MRPIHAQGTHYVYCFFFKGKIAHKKNFSLRGETAATLSSRYRLVGYYSRALKSRVEVEQ